MEPQQIEELTLNAWPALNTYLYDGWIVRFANGYTGRANSVTPLYAGGQDLAEKIAHCEALYRRRGLRPRFRLPSTTTPAGLDDLLAAQGYIHHDLTSVQGVALAADQFTLSPRAELEQGEGALESWLKLYHAFSGPHRADHATHAQILRQICGESCFMTLRVAGEAVACGLAVRDGRAVGLFDIVTAERERRQGYGRELVESLLAWGSGLGADYAYLQVMRNNAAALPLYAKLGFTERYYYWYRLAPEQT